MGLSAVIGTRVETKNTEKYIVLFCLNQYLFLIRTGNLVKKHLEINKWKSTYDWFIYFLYSYILINYMSSWQKLFLKYENIHESVYIKNTPVAVTWVCHHLRFQQQSLKKNNKYKSLLYKFNTRRKFNDS